MPKRKSKNASAAAGNARAAARNRKRPEKKARAEIAYQNKDIASKMFAERLKGKSLRVYGVDMGEIRAVLPTNIPAIRVNELRLDNLLELEDGTTALVDYESEYKRESKVKYLNYLTGVVNRYEKEGKSCPRLRMIVVYTGDIPRKAVTEEYDVGAVRVVMESAFLSELDGEEMLGRLKQKVEGGEPLDDREQMEFIILPLSYKRREEKEAKIREAVELAVRVRDREQQLFVLAGILTFTDKIIDEESAKIIRRAIQMTKVAMIFEKEKEEAVKEAVKAEKQKTQKALMEEKKNFARKMIKDKGLPLEKIAEYAGLDIREVAELAGREKKQAERAEERRR